MAALGIIGFLGFIGCVIWLIVSAIKRQKKKNSLIGMGIALVLFIVGVANSPSSQTVPTSTASESSTSTTSSAPASSVPAANIAASSFVPSSKTGSVAPNENSDSLSTGDKMTVNSSLGKYSVTIDSVTESTKRNEFADEQPKRIIIVNYSYKNISCKQDITVSYLYFHVYDANGNLLETYPSTDAHGPTQTISEGKQNSASVAYGANDSSNQISLELYDVFNPLNRVATYNLSIKK